LAGCMVFANCSALITSTHTDGSLPSTQASCPGATVHDIPGTIVVSEPSFRRTLMRPETQWPTYEA
jgi:hypothetical protein